MKKVTKEELRRIKLSAALFASLTGVRVRFNDYGEIIIEGFVICKIQVED